ncbi:phBC6A51 family helix-turn-helix protein [Lysinibacillus sp. NPDC097162]|uniref:phBC6A51 family helix-turn-helix protein n=1 Tax=Lysinibacillus sp. NPDC097162 TaxID=3364140 RepID=UPI00380E609D
MAKLNDKQYAAIAILSQPKRGGLTYDQVAEQIGVSRTTLTNWRKQDDFNEELKREIMRRTIDRLPEIMDAIPDIIINEGNAAMFRTLLQAQGLLTDKVEVSTQGNTEDIDAIKAKLEALRGKQS